MNSKKSGTIDGIPDELWTTLEAELPDLRNYLRSLRTRLGECESDAVNADTGLQAATSVAELRAIRRMASGQSKRPSSTVAWWQLVLAMSLTTLVILAGLHRHSAAIESKLADAMLESQERGEIASREICRVVKEEVQAAAQLDFWRVPNRVDLQKLPAGTYQILERNPNGAERWVNTEIFVRYPQWMPSADK